MITKTKIQHDQHTLSVDECARELRTNPHQGLMAASHGRRRDDTLTNKDLYVITTLVDSGGVWRGDVHFRVEVNRDAAYDGDDLAEAIAIYNAAP